MVKIMENPIKMGLFGGISHHFRKHPCFCFLKMLSSLPDVPNSRPVDMSCCTRKQLQWGTQGRHLCTSDVTGRSLLFRINMPFIDDEFRKGGTTRARGMSYGAPNIN